LIEVSIMHRIRFIGSVAPFLLVSLAACGCGRGTSAPPETPHPHETELRQIWLMYRGGKANQGQIPARLADFKKYQQMYADGYRALEHGECVVFWGLDLGKAADGAAIVAYEKTTPQKGGSVVLADGTVKEMTAEEFRAAPKPGK
jgi:hypothetical protein